MAQSTFIIYRIAQENPLLPEFFTAKIRKLRQKKKIHCNLHRDLPEFFLWQKKVWQKVLCNGAQGREMSVSDPEIPLPL